MEQIPNIATPRPRKDGKHARAHRLNALVDLFLALFKGGDRHDDEK